MPSENRAEFYKHHINAETGVCEDYLNETWASWQGYLESGIDALYAYLKSHITRVGRIRRYEENVTENFPLVDYSDIITEKNKDRVDRINRIADGVTCLVDAEKFLEKLNAEEALSIAERVYFLIYGNSHRDSQAWSGKLVEWENRLMGV